jgi:hypothetical protein
MENYIVGHCEVRPKDELCDCGHPKDSHSSVDTICYGDGKCKCGCSYPLRVRMPRIGSTQKVNFNLKKPQFNPWYEQAKILKIIKAERVYHRNHGESAYVLCDVETKNGHKKLAYVEWADEE